MAYKFFGAGHAVWNAMTTEVNPQATAVTGCHPLPIIVPTAADAEDLPVLCSTYRNPCFMYFVPSLWLSHKQYQGKSLAIMDGCMHPGYAQLLAVNK